MDRWRDEAAFRACRQAKKAEYHALDQRCLSVTESESRIGHFRAWDGAPPGDGS